jgi:hypothetical protein
MHEEISRHTTGGEERTQEKKEAMAMIAQDAKAKVGWKVADVNGMIHRAKRTNELYNRHSRTREKEDRGHTYR